MLYTGNLYHAGYGGIFEVTESEHRIFTKFNLALFTIIAVIHLTPWPDISLHSVDYIINGVKILSCQEIMVQLVN